MVQRVAIGEKARPSLEAESKARQTKPLKNVGKSSLAQKCANEKPPGKTSEFIAEAAGVSPNLHRARAVMVAADDRQEFEKLRHEVDDPRPAGFLAGLMVGQDRHGLGPANVLPFQSAQLHGPSARQLGGDEIPAKWQVGMPQDGLEFVRPHVAPGLSFLVELDATAGVLADKALFNGPVEGTLDGSLRTESLPRGLPRVLGE
jgi:hypothetical protein